MHNRHIKQLLFGALLLLLAACKKDYVTLPGTSILNVVQAAMGVNSVRTSVNTIPYITLAGYGVGTGYMFFSGNTAIQLQDTSAAAKVLYHNQFDGKPGGIYSLFLAGQSPAIEGVFTEDTIRYFFPDSAVGVRFVNLSPNSVAVTINRKDSASKEVTNLAYKSVSSFKAYPARSTNTSLVLEVRKASDNSLLFTYTFSISAAKRFRNVTIAIKGMIGGTGTSAIGVFEVNHF